MMRSFSVSRVKRLFIIWLSLIFTVIATSLSVFAADSTADQQAMTSLQTYVYNVVSGRQYQVDGGGFLSGDQLLVRSGDGYDLDEDAFNTLSVSAQSELVSDIAELSNEAITAVDGGVVTESTVQNWWKELQSKDGVGTQFLNEILRNTRPDFVTANKIYQPFSGPIGIVLGLLSVLIIALLGIVILVDLFYIVIPPFRNIVSDGEGNKAMKFVKSKLISHEAITAVQVAESGGEDSKSALGIYIKKKAFSMILLVIALMYLVNNQLYTFIGWLLNLMRGFLGF